jgi:alpha-tubulin suppressor-like RCC1 family protein
VAPRAPATAVAGLPAIVAVAAGDNYSLAIDATGRVWWWGRSHPGNRSGAGSRATPALLGGLTGVVAIAAGSEHALFLKSDGSVLAWGSNRNGRLGDGTDTDRATPTPTLLSSRIIAVAAGGDNSLALRDDGVVLSWGINETGQLGTGSSSPGFRLEPGAVVGLADVVAISMGAAPHLGHALALRRDGSVWAWGYNNAGQLGDGSTSARMAPVQVPGLNLN